MGLYSGGLIRGSLRYSTWNLVCILVLNKKCTRGSPPLILFRSPPMQILPKLLKTQLVVIMQYSAFGLNKKNGSYYVDILLSTIVDLPSLLIMWGFLHETWIYTMGLNENLVPSIPGILYSPSQRQLPILLMTQFYSTLC